MGAGLALTVAPLTSAILGAIEPERSGIASAVNNAVSRVAGLIAVALLATIVGGALDLDGFHRAAVVTAALMIAGGARVVRSASATECRSRTAETDPRSLTSPHAAGQVGRSRWPRHRSPPFSGAVLARRSPPCTD